MIDLNALPVFDAVVEMGSFTAAADRLGVAKAKVSLTISRMERALGTALFTRTTRQVTLTEAGRNLYEQCQPLLQGLEEALAQAGRTHADLVGTLRISTTVIHSAQQLAPIVAEFAALHPGLQIDLRTTDRVVDLVAEGIDLSFRMGWLRDSSQRAIKLGEFGQDLVAAPAYLARHAAPKRPADLVQHDWLALSLLPTPRTWKFHGPKGEVETVHTRSRLQVDSAASLVALAVAGAGITAIDTVSSAPLLASGALVRLLPKWTLPRGGIYAVLPPGRHVPARVRAFIDFYRSH